MTRSHKTPTLPVCGERLPPDSTDMILATELKKTKRSLRSRGCIDPVKSCSCYKGEDVAMSETVAEEIKRWTAKRKSALVIEIIQGKTTIAAASRTYARMITQDDELYLYVETKRLLRAQPEKS